MNASNNLYFRLFFSRYQHLIFLKSGSSLQLHYFPADLVDRGWIADSKKISFQLASSVGPKVPCRAVTSKLPTALRQ